ncbi:MAG: hypothetical protein P8Y74_18580 [Desulfobacterales bacterium]
MALFDERFGCFDAHFSGANKNSSHVPSILLPNQVPGYNITNQAMISSLPISMSTHKIPLSSAGNVALVSPTESPTVPVAETTSKSPACQPGLNDGVFRQAGPQEDQPKHTCRDQQSQQFESARGRSSTAAHKHRKDQDQLRTRIELRTRHRGKTRGCLRGKGEQGRVMEYLWPSHTGAKPHDGAHRQRSDQGSDYDGPDLQKIYCNAALLF